MFRTTIASACLVIALGTPGFAQVKLEHKIKEESTSTTESYTHLEQKLTIAGMETETTADNRVTVKSTSGKRDAAGWLRVQEKIESLQVSTSVMGLNYSFDSAAPDNKGDSPLEFLRDIHKGLAKRVTTTVFDKSNKVIAIESDQDILSSLPVEIQGLLKSQLDPEYLKKAANQALAVLPTESVNKGDTWERTESANFGAGQVMTFQNRYTYEGTVEKSGKTFDKITSKTLSVNFSLEPDSPLPFKLKGSELKAAESEGVILFDRAAGQIVEHGDATRITGGITFDLNGMELPSTLDLKMQSAVTKKK